MTARGNATVIQEAMIDPYYSAVLIDVEDIDDHRQTAFVVEGGVERRWLDEEERSALGRRVEALRDLAATL